MRRFMGMLLVLMALGLASCNPTMNLQRSGLRGIGDLTAVVYLERHAVANPLEFREACIKVLDYIDTGAISALPLDKVEAELRRIVPARWAGFVPGIIAAASSRHADLATAIGLKNVQRLRAYVMGLVHGADGYEPQTLNRCRDLSVGEDRGAGVRLWAERPGPAVSVSASQALSRGTIRS